MPQYYVSTGITVAIRPGFDTLYGYRLVPGEFTGDGKLDFIVTYSLFPNEDRTIPLRLMAGDGLGGFTDRTDALFGSNPPQSVHPRDITVADFNRDGRADFFIADQGLDAAPFPGGQNTLVLSSGANGLANETAQIPTARAFTHSTEAVDVDRDGDPDIFVGSEANPAPYFLINDGAGRFTVASDRLPAAVSGAGHLIFTTEAFFDADGDGDQDLFLGAARQTGVNKMLLNDGTGRFTEVSESPPLPATWVAGSDAVDAQAMDVNGDGRQDLVVVYTIGENGARAYTQVLINQGGGVFADETAARIPATFQGVSTTGAMIVADINGDGALDLLYARGTAAPLLLNDGAGRFVHMPAGFVPANGVGGSGDVYGVGDVNGDGRLDLISWFGRGNGQEFLRVDLSVDAGATQVGTAGVDGLMGDGSAETINGLAGNDVIVGGGGRDYLRGDEGDDVIVGGAAFDDINGNMGNDTVSTGGGEDYCVGGKDNDSLSGGAAYDLVYGNLGNDTCRGDDGDDIVRGGQDNDIVDGGTGNDFVSGDRGDDTMTGGLGADNFHTFGETGIDRVTDFNLAQGDRVQLDAGTQFTVSQSGADTIISMTGGGQMILVGVQMSTLTPGWIFGA